VVVTEAAGSRKEEILLKAVFDERLKTYFLLGGLGLIAVMVFTIPLIPLWLLGVGQALCRRHYESLEAELCDRNLNIRKGFLVRVQKTVPLEKITDLALHEGPILRWLGLCSLKVETAGGGGASNMGQVSLPGVVDAIAFRDAVLNQRDLVAGSGGTVTAAAPEAVASAPVLEEIRDTLGRIETLLSDRS
jgi:putative membrane protein